MRKIVFLMFFVVTAVVTWLHFLDQRKEVVVNPEQHSINESKYFIDRNETIDKVEAEKIPPNERWHVIKDLKETTAINRVCQTSSSEIIDQNTVKEIVDLFQNSKYVEVTEYPNREPDVKLYFRKNDGFILAGRLHITEGVISSPEGPVIKIDSMAI